MGRVWSRHGHRGRPLNSVVRPHGARRRRDRGLFNLAIDSKLRACDLVSLKLKDIGHPDRIAARATVMQQKTKRPVQFEITDGTRKALLDWTAAKGLKYDDYLFSSRGRPGAHISTRQYGRIVDRWASSLGLDPAAYGTHTMRRTKASLITGKRRTFGRCGFYWATPSSKAHLGIEVDDALQLAEQTDILQGLATAWDR